MSCRLHHRPHFARPRLLASLSPLLLKTENKLVALDAMRCGNWYRAFYLLYGRDPEWQIGSRLSLLPRPVLVNFNGWDQFDLHLASLEAIIPELREIEAAALPS